MTVMKCRKCKSEMVPAASGGPFPQPLYICPNYRWYHLTLHDVLVLARR